MTRIEPKHAAVFIGVCSVVAFLINSTQHHRFSALNFSLQQQAPVTEKTTQPFKTAPPIAAPVPIPVRPIIWPGDVPATKIIHIPNPEHPTTGIMDNTLRVGDELEMDWEPLWFYSTQELPSAIEIAFKNDGGNFESPEEYRKNNPDNNGTNAWWTKKRIVRLRLKPGFRDETTFRFVIEKINEDAIKPLPYVAPQQYHELSVAYTKFQGLKDGTIQIDLTFENLSNSKTIAVAMYGDVCSFEPCPVLSSLIAADGTQYTINTGGLTGIKCIRALPQKLTAIEPNGQLKASLNFEPQGRLSDSVKSFKMQMQIVVNLNFNESAYDNYRPTHDLPPHCQVVDMIFEMPVRWN